MSEKLDVYNYKRIKTGKIIERNENAILDKCDYILAIQCWIINAKCEILLWDNANEVIFMLAKKVDGWGKIHLVNKLEVKNENIKEWLITDGCYNKVDFSYLARPIADKINLIEVLHRDNLNKKQLKGINNIMEGLLEEDSPIIGMKKEKNTTS